MAKPLNGVPGRSLKCVMDANERGPFEDHPLTHV